MSSPFLAQSEIYPEDEGQRIIRTTQIYVDQAAQINTKDTGYYFLQEVPTGRQYFDPTNPQLVRYAYRISVQIPATAAGGTSTIAHGVSGITQIVDVQAIANTSADFRPLPYASVTANANIECKADATNVTVIVGASSPNVTGGLVVLDYLK